LTSHTTCRVTAPDVDHHGAALRCGGAFADDDRDGSQQPIDGVLGGRPAEVAGFVNGAADVLFVQPAVQDADAQEIGHRPRPGRCRHLLGEVGLVTVAKRRQPKLDQFAPLGQDLGPGERAAGLDVGLVELADRILDVITQLRQRRGCGQTLQHPFGADEVRQVVPHGPTWQIGG
jgi:hypothetical protein